MKMKINLYIYLILMIILEIIILSSAKNVLLVSNESTRQGKKCFLKKLMKEFKLKKFEEKIKPFKNIYEGTVAGHNVTFFDFKSHSNNHTKNSILYRNMQPKLKSLNITAIDSIIMFYSLEDDDENSKIIEKDLEYIKSNFGENVTKSIALAAINQRRMRNVKRTYLDELTHRLNMSYIHIQSLCNDQLNKEIIIKDLNFVFKMTNKFNLNNKEPIPNENEKSRQRAIRSTYGFIIGSLVLIGIVYLYNSRLMKAYLNKRKSNNKDIEEKNTPNIKMEREFAKKEEIVESNENVNAEKELMKEEKKKEIYEILNNLQLPLCEEVEQQEEENISTFIEPIEFEKEQEEKQNEEISIGEVESIKPSDPERLSDDKVDNLTESIANPILSEKQEVITKNDWEFLG